MLQQCVTILIAVISVVLCQIDGEFWWVKNDITKLRQGTAPTPLFDDVNELDTDETAKIIFRESDAKKGKSLDTDEKTLSVIHFRDETELSKPFLEFNQLNVNNKLWNKPLKQINVTKNNSLSNSDDELRFVFPTDNSLIWIDGEYKTKNNKTLVKEDQTETSNKDNNTTDAPKLLSQNKVSSYEKNPLLPENICTFIQKSECIRNEGTLYEPWMNPNMIMTLSNTQTICCILPITTTTISKIIFPDNYNWGANRHKRSNVDGETPGLKQRNNLMTRKYVSNNQKIRLTTPSTHIQVNHKFDEYSIDPYWNIKNSNIRNPDIPTYQDPDKGSDYGSSSYSDDYTVELPKPGLIGLYSDHKETQSTWTYNKNKDFYYDTPDSVEEEESETSFGYSTIDPRKDHRLTSAPSKRFRPRPLKLTAASSRFPEPGLQNPTITFHSNPDFKVLQGFKLLNLMRSKNRFVRKSAETDEEFNDNGLKTEQMQQKFTNHYHNTNDLDIIEAKLKQKLLNECGKTQNKPGDSDNGFREGIVEFGSHPWIVLVVLTKSEHSILCYATLVHPRVAVSVADCVNGKSPGAVSVIAGVRNLDEDLPRSQRRMATITIDPNYTPGNLKHNLALLHWLRTLTLDARVQPACLGDSHTEDSCLFVGWGGYDQEMHSDLRWQQASILPSQNCYKRLSKLEVSDALCAAVESRGTVTGIGGPLLCKSSERWSVVGVAVCRNDSIILLPPREWVMRNMMSLGIE